MSSIRAELMRALTRGNLALLALMTALVAFAMVKAGPQGHPAVQGLKDASIFLATFLMGRAATTAASDNRAGTLRTWLISQPSRMITYAGKLTASLAVACIGGLVLIGVAWGLSALLGHRVDEVTTRAIGGGLRGGSDRVKTDARDAMLLARLLRLRLRLDEIVSVTAPSVQWEAARDLVRAREDVRGDLMRARRRVSKLLLRRSEQAQTWSSSFRSGILG